MTSIYIRTYGCTYNQCDSHKMQAVLQRQGYSIVNSPENADLIIFNTCTVKSPTENTFFKELRNTDKPVIIAGCIAQTDPHKLKGYSIIGTEQIQNISQIVEETLRGNTVCMIDRNNNQDIDLPFLLHNPVTSIIQISRGCMGSCTFCKTRMARSSLFSYPKAIILDQIIESIKTGAKKIWLTSQDNACWGFDKGMTLKDLMDDILNIDKDFMIRIGMGNPNHILKIKHQIIDILKHPKVFKFIHIPVQSGCNRILKKMGRRYTKEDYISLIKLLKKEIPEITIATDIICGFPGETKQEFNETIELIKQTKPDTINISRFWPREGTPASKFPDQLTGGETKERSRELTKIFNETAKEHNKKWLNWQGEVLVDELGKHKNNFITRNPSYKQIIIDGEFRLGQKINIKVTQTNIFDLKGKLC